MKLTELHALGTSLWVDDLSRAKLTSRGEGSLPSRIAQGARGVTTNPSIFMAAIAGSQDYFADIDAMKGSTVDDVIEKLTSDDVRVACNLFADLYRTSRGVDGRVSIEVDPRYARDTEKTIEQARHLWKVINRPNLMIKVPATREGLPAITTLISEGISVNVTLIFSVERYEEVIDAYFDGLEKAESDLSQIHSVASFFISRIDSSIDPLLKEKGAGHLLGKAAVANARAAYQLFEGKKGSQRWAALSARGAHMQRPLWASTGVKDPAYSPTLYVDSLIAPDTVNTAPQATIDATIASGTNSGFPFNYQEVNEIFTELERLGISLSQITDELERDGVKKFEDAWLQLIASVEKALS